MMRAPDQKEIQAKRLFIGRSLAALLIVVVALAIVLIRLYWLQIQHHDHFKTLATDNRIKLLPLPPSRGEIYDRNGVKLAENITSVDLVIVPDQVDDIDAVIVELQEILTITEDDINRFTKLKRRKRRFEQVPIRTDLSQQEMALFAVERHRFPGVDLGVAQSLVLEHQVVHGAPVRADGRDHVVALALQHAGVVGPLRNEERRLDLVIIGHIDRVGIAAHRLGIPGDGLQVDPPRRG